jgi:hypothetical protein
LIISGTVIIFPSLKFILKTPEISGIVCLIETRIFESEGRKFKKKEKSNKNPWDL